MSITAPRRLRLTATFTAVALFASLAIPAIGSAAAGDFLMIGRITFMTLPTSGSAWTAMKSVADGSWGSPNLCDQNYKTGVKVLAGAMVAARTNNVAMRLRVRDAIKAAMPTIVPGCSNSILSLGRQLGAYVLAADFIDQKVNFPSDDAAFRSWLSSLRTRELGGHSIWHVLRTTADISANNWGTFALASMIAADRYLGDATGVAHDWAVFKGYGDQGWTFKRTSSYSTVWQCGVAYRAINLPCVKSGVNLDGAPVEDSSRGVFPVFSSYIHESLQGYTFQAQLLSMGGYLAWTVNAGQVCRASQFANRAGRLNDSGVGYSVAFMANAFCGSALPTKTPTSGGRIFGYADWLFSR
jgi:hypothetical protein